MTRRTTLGLDGRTVLVTGGTRGLGLAVGRKLCACGCDVLLDYAHCDADAAEAARAMAGLPGTVRTIRADIAAPDALFAQVEAYAGGLDALVHCAAPWRPGPAVGAGADDLAQALRTVAAPLLSPSLPGLMASGGRVVVVSSSGAGRVIPGYMTAGVTKAALESLVRYLAVELAGRGIAVNAVSTTKLDRGAGTPNPEMARVLAARTPAGRLTRADDVADVVALLCTDAAGWTHGQVITVDGGLGLLA